MMTSGLFDINHKHRVEREQSLGTDIEKGDLDGVRGTHDAKGKRCLTRRLMEKQLSR
jgi:hypothetical protein